MAKNKQKGNQQLKEPKGNPSEIGIIENPDVLRERLLGPDNFFQKNRTAFIVIAAVALVAIVGTLIYTSMKGSQEAEADKQMFAAVYYFEADSLNKALNGDGNYLGFLDIIDNYPMSSSANLAHFYAGVAQLKLGKFDEAIKHLKKFSSKDLLLQARAYVLLGDAHLEKNQVDQAIDYYKKAAGYKPNKSFTPQYLMKLALAYELKGDQKSALSSYERIITEFPTAVEVTSAKKYKAKLEASTDK
ncbi:YfgM family protein [Eisenibacter elegans]|jgi:tetratricopeptide (TPR) repeat protein|uniref:YfgM family protein n=1 Tax=Eisenibacter elegans TaxID=997 RepID=UPI00041C41A6|nr:tetratricopeptide repeat protein [Eisenibacter elegans]